MATKLKKSQWEKVFKETWDIIGIFEAHELKNMKDYDDLRWEARTSARMEAYVKLVERLADGLN